MKRTVVMLVITALAVLAGIFGCEAEFAPYVRTQIVGAYQLGWFFDGPELAITVTNPTAFNVEVEVQCVGAAEVWEVKLPPKGSTWGLGRVMNRDAAFSPCWRKSWRVLP